MNFKDQIHNFRQMLVTKCVINSIIYVARLKYRVRGFAHLRTFLVVFFSKYLIAMFGKKKV